MPGMPITGAVSCGSKSEVEEAVQFMTSEPSDFQSFRVIAGHPPGVALGEPGLGR